MRVGVFGGTFNPVHIGHIRGAISTYETFKLDKVLFLPIGIPPHKKDNVAAAEYRYQMLKMAIDGLEGFEISRLELDSDTVNYTIDTVRELKKLYPSDELFFMVGTDAFFYLDLWKEYKTLVSLIPFILICRPEYDTGPVEEKYSGIVEFVEAVEVCPYECKPGRVYIYKPPAFDISSSMVRDKVRSGSIIRYLVPEAVEKFIIEKGLYRL